MRSNIKRVFWVYFILFFSMIIYLINFTLNKSSKIIGNSNNPRIKSPIFKDVVRGDILDKNGEVLAKTIDGKRIYPFENLFCHTVGFNVKGKSGIEAKYNFELQKLDDELKQRIEKEKNPEYELKGNSLILTLDKNLQEFAYKKLNNRKGAIVVMDSKTGAILSMVSYPDFNPQTVNENWEKLILDEENNPLLNRATQGLYPPASVFKIIMAATFIENYPDWKDYIFNCQGIYTFANHKISCFNNNIHKDTNLEKALTVSCNTFFASLINKISPLDLKNVAQKFLFNKSLDFPLEYRKSVFALKPFAKNSEVLQTFIGQGKTLVTPLHIALIGCAIANNGVIMKPYILDSIINYKGATISKTNPEQLKTVLDFETASIIKDMLKNVIEEGTGKKAKDENFSICGKTGTAQIQGKKDHTWFLGIAPTENPSIVISVILENSGSSDVVKISKDILKKALNIK